jgi:hypothetical protein
MRRSSRRRIERRSRRASHPVDATRFYFEHLVERGGPEAVVLSDGDTVLAGIGADEPTLSRLAAFGAACVYAKSGWVPEFEEHDVYAHALHCGRRRFVLTTLGARVRTLRGVEDDLTRIFGANEAA